MCLTRLQSFLSHMYSDTRSNCEEAGNGIKETYLFSDVVCYIAALF